MIQKHWSFIENLEISVISGFNYTVYLSVYNHLQYLKKIEQPSYILR